MRLAETIQSWLKEQEWEDELRRDEEAGKSQVSTRYNIGGQVYRLFIEGDEKRDWLKVYLYAPINVKKEKRKDAFELFNHINIWTGPCKIYLSDDGTIGVLQVVDVEDAEPSLKMISNMIGAASNIYSTWFDEISSVALTKMTAQEIFDDLASKEEEAKEEDVPDTL